jgi:hypothetical protein
MNGSSSAFLFLGILWIALLVGVIFFALPLWVLALNILCVMALLLRGYGATASVMTGLLVCGSVFSSQLFTLPPVWIFAMLGVVAVVVIGIHLATPKTGGAVSVLEGGGDQNPIPIILMAIGQRVWLFTFDASNTAWSDETPNIVTTVIASLFGVVDDFPLWVNAFLFVLVNGSLLLWGVLLLKRTVNPVAN